MPNNNQENGRLSAVKEQFQLRFHSSLDLKFREFNIFSGQKILLVFLSTMADKPEMLNETLKSFYELKLNKLPIDTKNIADYCLNHVITNAEAEKSEGFDSAVNAVMRGDCVLFFECTHEFLILSIKGYAGRAITEPPNQATIRGPREGFTEDIKTNLMLLRKRVHSPDLVFEQLEVGRYTKTLVSLCYLKTIADPKTVRALKEKISKIDIDAINDSSYIQKFLEKSPYSIFKQVGVTEKSDICAAKIMEGRVAIVVDNSPMVLTVPFLLYENFQNNEDYYARKHKSDYVRLLRIVSIFLAVSLPAFHVAVLIHDYHIIPLKYMIAVMNATVNTPVSPLVEMLLVLFLFDLLHEASVRMPRSIGLALNIVGALVLGDTAVKAGIISPPSVIVGAVSGIGLFAVPEQGATFAILRIVFLLVADFLGLFGLLLALMFLVMYLVSLDNFHTPYLAPFAPYIKEDLKDGVLREELTETDTRPLSIPNINKTRLKKPSSKTESP